MRTRFEIPGVQGLVVFQRQDSGDNWYARIPIRVPGERRYKVIVLRDGNGQTTTSQQIAIQLAMLEYGRVLAKKKDGTVSTLWDVSFSRLLDEYLEHLLADPKSKPSTPRRARFAAKPLREFFGERAPILDVAKRLDEYPAWRLRQPVRAGKQPRARKRPSVVANAEHAEPKLVAPTTVQHEMNVLNACLTWAAKKKGYLRLEDIQDHRFGVDDEEKGTRSALERSEWEIIRDWCWEWAQSNSNAYIVADDGKVRSPIAKLTFKSFAWMQDGVLLLTAADLKAIGNIKALEGWKKVGSMSGVGALLIGQSYADWEDAWRKGTNEAKDKRYAVELEKFRNGQRKKEPELKYVAEYEFKAGITHERAEDGFVSHTFRSGITRIGLPTSTFSPIYSTILDAEAINVWGDWERLRNEGDYRVMISGNELRWALLDNKAISNLTIELPDTFEAAAKIELLVKGGDFLSAIQFLLGTTDKVDEGRIEFAFNPDAALFRLDLGGEVREMLVPLLNDNGKGRNTNEVNIMLAEITPARDDLFTKVEKGKGDPEELFKRFAERGSATMALPA